MRTFSEEELQRIIKNHEHWINEDCDEWTNGRRMLHMPQRELPF